jgi:TATA-box binding protein (TBP) (component of TFIID and TFIIIB)
MEFKEEDRGSKSSEHKKHKKDKKDKHHKSKKHSKHKKSLTNNTSTSDSTTSELSSTILNIDTSEANTNPDNHKNHDNQTNSVKPNINNINSINNKKLDFKATNLTISTCTVITNINSKVHLGLITRFINIYEQYSPELNEKSGGIYNLEFYGNCARGETLIDKIKDEFNNQATIKFKYWGFRNVNIKIFANGRLQMTGLKNEEEATVVSELLINILKNIKVNVLNDITKLTEISKTYDFQLVFDPKTKNVSYYRKYYDRFLKDYEFDTDLVYKLPVDLKTPTKSDFVNLKRKNYVKGIHDIYNINSDPIEEANFTFLKDNEWNGDLYIRHTINKIDKIKECLNLDISNTLSNCKNLDEVKSCIETIMKKYTDFKFSALDKILSDISKKIYSSDEQTLLDIKYEIFKFNRLYSSFLEKKINRLVTIRTIDITICNAVKEYLIETYSTNTDNIIDPKSDSFSDSFLDSFAKLNINLVPEPKLLDLISNIEIPIEKLDLITKSIEEPHNYYVSNIETVLINSDFSINHNINLKRISKILKKKGLFNSYEPDEYPGVLTKYYYNPNNEIQGICNCNPHCSTKEKHSVCTKITISLFRPGSIIITGARAVPQLISAYDLILKILADNLEHIKGIEYDDDNKQIALMNNEFRKISKKPRLFFIKKTNIVDFEKIFSELSL